MATVMWNNDQIEPTFLYFISILEQIASTYDEDIEISVATVMELIGVFVSLSTNDAFIKNICIWCSSRNCY